MVSFAISIRRRAGESFAHIARTIKQSDVHRSEMVAIPDPINDSAAIRDLRRIPGVGRTIAGDFLRLGIRSVPELRGADPQALYEALCRNQGMHVDRCMLYVFRCAVYFAGDGPHDPKLLLWWSWKDGGPAYTSPRANTDSA